MCMQQAWQLDRHHTVCTPAVMYACCRGEPGRGGDHQVKRCTMRAGQLSPLCMAHQRSQQRAGLWGRWRACSVGAGQRPLQSSLPQTCAP